MFLPLQPGQGGNASAYAPFLASATARIVACASAASPCTHFPRGKRAPPNPAPHKTRTTGASANKVKLIFAWTTPWLNAVATDNIITGILNPAAAKIMTPYGIPQVDLHKPIIDKCGAAPQASCFGQTGCWSPHCPPGYKWLADNYITPVIRAALST